MPLCYNAFANLGVGLEVNDDEVNGDFKISRLETSKA